MSEVPSPAPTNTTTTTTNLESQPVLPIDSGELGAFNLGAFAPAEISKRVHKGAEAAGLQIEEARIGLLGMRRAWAERRQNKAVGKLAEKATALENPVPPAHSVTRRQGIARETAKGDLHSDKYTPVTRRERRADDRASKLREKRIKQELERNRLQSIHGSGNSVGKPRTEKYRDNNGNETSVDLKVQELPVRTLYGKPAEAIRDEFEILPKDRYRYKWGEVRPDTRGRPIPKPNDLGTRAQLDRLKDGTYSKRQILEETRGAVRFHRATRKMDKIDRKLAKAKGLPVVDKRLERKVNSRAAKANRLAAKHMRLANKEQLRRDALARRKSPPATPAPTTT